MHRLINNCVPDLQNSPCCVIEGEEDGEIVGLRKNIIIKSAGKNQKKQKISLKKRACNSIAEKPIKTQLQNEQSPIKPIQQRPIVHQTRRIVQPRMNQAHNIHPNNITSLNQTNNINTIRYTPQKPHNAPNFKQNKINFIYNNNPIPRQQQQEFNFNQPHAKIEYNSVPSSPITKIGIKQQNTNNTTANCSQKHSVIKIDHQNRSTQNTNIPTQIVESCDDFPGLSKQFKFDMFTPLKFSQKIQSSQPLTSLSSRKKTVMSINGDSESERSIALLDLQPLPIMKHSNLVQTARLIGQTAKINYSNIKSSINW